MGLFFDFLYILTMYCVTTGNRKMHIEYMFCFICNEQCITTISSLEKYGLFCSVLKKNIHNNTTPTFQDLGGVT